MCPLVGTARAGEIRALAGYSFCRQQFSFLSCLDVFMFSFFSCLDFLIFCFSVLFFPFLVFFCVDVFHFLFFPKSETLPDVSLVMPRRSSACDADGLHDALQLVNIKKKTITTITEPLARSSAQGNQMTRDPLPLCLWIMGSSQKDRKACIISILDMIIIIATVTFIIIIVIIRGSNHYATCMLLPCDTFHHNIWGRRSCY